MKIAVWVVFVLLAGLWTSLAAVSVQLIQWLATSAASGQVTDAAMLAGQQQLPGLLAVWLDPALLQGLQSSWLFAMQWTAQVLPSVGGLVGWVAPIIWVVCGLGMLVLLVVAMLGHWAVGRLASNARSNSNGLT